MQKKEEDSISVSWISPKIFHLASLLGAVVTILGFFLAFVKSKPELEVKILTADQLTKDPSAVGISAVYKYKEREVRDLWKVRIELKNTGKVTLIGSGNAKNIIGESIEMIVSDQFDLLDYEIDAGSQKNMSVAREGDRRLDFGFLQWRSGESVLVSLFVERLNKTNMVSSKMFDFKRVLIDGDINLLELGESVADKKPILDSYSTLGGALARGLIYIILGAMFLVPVGTLPIALIGEFRAYRRRVKWRKIYLVPAKNHLLKKLTAEDWNAISELKTNRAKRGSHFNKAEAVLKNRVDKSLEDFEGSVPGDLDWMLDDQPSFLLKAVQVIFSLVLMSLVSALLFLSIYPV